MKRRTCSSWRRKIVSLCSSQLATPSGRSQVCGLSSFTVWWPSGARSRIHERRRGHEQPRHALVVRAPVAHGAAQLEHVLRPADGPRRDGAARAVRRLELGRPRRWRGSTPCRTCRRRRSRRRRGTPRPTPPPGAMLDELLDVDRREHRARAPCSARRRRSRRPCSARPRARARTPGGRTAPSRRGPRGSASSASRERARAAARDRPAAPLAAEDDRVRDCAPSPRRRRGTSVWNACQIMNAWTCRSSNSRRITSQALIALRRSQMRPRGCSSSISSSDGPKPGGVTRARPKIPLTSSYSPIRRR